MSPTNARNRLIDNHSLDEGGDKDKSSTKDICQYLTTKGWMVEDVRWSLTGSFNRIIKCSECAWNVFHPGRLPQMLQTEDNDDDATIGGVVLEPHRNCRYLLKTFISHKTA